MDDMNRQTAKAVLVLGWPLFCLKVLDVLQSLHRRKLKLSFQTFLPTHTEQTSQKRNNNTLDSNYTVSHRPYRRQTRV